MRMDNIFNIFNIFIFNTKFDNDEFTMKDDISSGFLDRR